MKLLGITRSSNQDVAQGYGPAIQEAELVAYCHTANCNLIKIVHVTEPATIDFDDRTLFQEAIAKAKRLKELSQCDGVVFSRCDRLSRQMEGAIQVALDLRKAGLDIHLARENQDLKPDDPPINFVMFVLQAFGVDAQTRIFLKNTKDGQRKAAEDGKLPSGVGAKGLFGYNLVGPQGEKKFEPNANIWIVDEVLRLGCSGNSINSSTRQLRQKGVNITRDTVRKILKHARVYAGIYRWGGTDIKGLVPPRITLEQAAIIEANMKRNKEHSYGWGRRKWLTGRVRCGICGASYALELGKKRCHCRHSNALETLNPCPAPKISYRKLEFMAWHALMGNIAQPEVLRRKLTELHKDWQKAQNKLRQQIEDLREQLKRLNDKRDRLSWQHAEGLLTNDQLVKRCKAMQSDIAYLGEHISQLEAMAIQPAPPDPEKAAELATEWAALTYGTEFNATEQQKGEVAEDCTLAVTIYPAEDAQLRLHIAAKIPLTVEEVEVTKAGEPVAIVCPSLQRR